MPLINCKVGLSLTQGEKWILSGNSAGTAARFKIIDAKLSVPVVTLLTENNIKLTKQLNDGFKGSVYWNKYRMIPNNKKEPPNNGTRYIREFLDASYQEAKVLFVLAYDNEINNDNTYTAGRVSTDSHKKYFLPRINIEI